MARLDWRRRIPRHTTARRGLDSVANAVRQVAVAPARGVRPRKVHHLPAALGAGDEPVGLVAELLLALGEVASPRRGRARVLGGGGCAHSLTEQLSAERGL